MGKTNAEAKTQKIVRIHNPHRDGYRRGGKAHAKGVADHPASDFTKEQLDALQADKLLVVTVVDAPATQNNPPPEA